MIRLARLADCALLPAVERSAGELFRTIGMHFVADADVPPAEFFMPLVVEGPLWIAADDEDRPIGFCACSLHGETLYVDELAIARNHQQRGCGRALMQAAIDGAGERGARRVALRTFRDVPWNGPFYRSLGFEVGDAPDLTDVLARVLEHERLAGLDPDSRCTMVLHFS